MYNKSHAKDLRDDVFVVTDSTPDLGLREAKDNMSRLKNIKFKYLLRQDEFLWQYFSTLINSRNPLKYTDNNYFQHYLLCVTNPEHAILFYVEHKLKVKDCCYLSFSRFITVDPNTKLDQSGGVIFFLLFLKIKIQNQVLYERYQTKNLLLFYKSVIFIKIWII